MRFVAMLLAVVVAAAIVAGMVTIVASAGRRRAERQRRSARWQVIHRGEHGITLVAVGLTVPGGAVVEEHVVERIPDSDPDWTARFLHAREAAEERAFHLNSTVEPPPGR